MSPPLSFIGHRFKTLATAISRVLKYAFAHPRFQSIAAEFFVEVGVLWFVFPILDTIVQFGTSKVSAKLTIVSIAIAVTCLFIAGIISRSIEKEEQQ